MATALTYYTEIQEPTVNGDVDLWGAILNSTNACWDRALAGEATASLAGGDWTPSTSEGECLVLTPTGVLGTNRNIIVPAKHRRYIVKNDTTGAFTVTIKTASGSGIVCTQGLLTYVYCDGTDCFLLGSTGAYYPIGTSGATVPLNNGNNTSSGNVTYSGTSSFTGSVSMTGGSGSPLTLQWSDDGATAGPSVNMTRVSTTPAASDLIGLWNFRGRDSGGNDTIYGRVQAQIIDPTDTSEDGGLAFYTMQAGTLTIGMSQRLGLFMAGTTDQGVGTINATGLYQGGVGLGTAAFAATGTSGHTLGYLDGNNTYSGTSTFTNTVSVSTGASTPFSLSWSDNGALAGPLVTLGRPSASPAASDGIGGVLFQGNNSTPLSFNYGVFYGVITDPTAGSEDFAYAFQTAVAGTLATRVNIGAGIYSQGVAGGDKGAGSINVATAYLSNVQINATTATTAIGTSGATIPLLNGNNAYSGTSSFTGVATFSGGAGSPAVFQWSDDGAGGGPNVYFERISTSPAASDRLGGLYLRGRDSAGNAQDYVLLDGRIDDPTSGSEDASMLFTVATAGTLLTQMELGLGLAMRGVSQMGAGTINATAYYKNGGVVQAPTIQVFTASGTWNRPTGCTKVRVRGCGGGGGGGGADSGSTDNETAGGGGGAGEFFDKLIDVTAISSVSVTIGAAGTAGSTTGGNGGAGGATSFGTHCSGNGGAGGIGTGSAAADGVMGAGGSGGSGGTAGDVNLPGQAGQGGFAFSVPGTQARARGGDGGSSPLGFGGRQTANAADGGVLAGEAGTGYGAGGSGASSEATSGAVGGAGTAGIVIVEEFYG